MNDMDREFLEEKEKDQVSSNASKVETEINRRRLFHNGIAFSK
jgi:hypothetical protein